MAGDGRTSSILAANEPLAALLFNRHASLFEISVNYASDQRRAQ
jgi:hypothetical protein